MAVYSKIVMAGALFFPDGQSLKVMSGDDKVSNVNEAANDEIDWKDLLKKARPDLADDLPGMSDKVQRAFYNEVKQHARDLIQKERWMLQQANAGSAWENTNAAWLQQERMVKTIFVQAWNDCFSQVPILQMIMTGRFTDAEKAIKNAETESLDPAVIADLRSRLVQAWVQENPNSTWDYCCTRLPLDRRNMSLNKVFIQALIKNGSFKLAQEELNKPRVAELLGKEGVLEKLQKLLLEAEKQKCKVLINSLFKNGNSKKGDALKRLRKAKDEKDMIDALLEEFQILRRIKAWDFWGAGRAICAAEDANLLQKEVIVTLRMQLRKAEARRKCRDDRDDICALLVIICLLCVAGYWLYSNYNSDIEKWLVPFVVGCCFTAFGACCAKSSKDCASVCFCIAGVCFVATIGPLLGYN